MKRRLEPRPGLLEGAVAGPIAFGAIVRPSGRWALTIALLFGLFSIASGVTAIMQGDQLRRTRNLLHSVLPTVA
jgi:hypothetical protein